MGKIIRRVIAVLLCATAVVLAVLPEGNAEATSTHGDYEYDGATVVKYLGSDSEVTLPAWVNRVGKEAFEDYDRMTKLVLPDTVTTVDFGAFSNCDNLKTVKMSESVRTLGSAAFSGCQDLYSVSVPRTVRDIGSGVFAGCDSLAEVSVSPANKNYTSYDGVIYTSDGQKLVQYLAGRPQTTYQMPVSVREIEEYAFWGADNLSRLSISYGVDKIPEYAFSNCKGLQHVTLPRSVQSIFAYAFEDCDNLSYINIPDSVGYIDDRAFSNTYGAKLRFVDSNGNVVKTFNSEDVEQYGDGTGGAPVVEPPGYMTGQTTASADQNPEGASGSGSAADQGGQTTAASAQNTTTTPDSTGTANTAGNTATTANTTDTDNNTNTTNTANSGADANATGSTSAGADSNTTGSTSAGADTSGNTSNAEGTSDASGASSASAAESNGSTTYYDDGNGGTYGETFDPSNVTPLDEGDIAEPSGTSSPEQSQTSAPENILSGNNAYNNGYYKASDSGSQPWDTQIEHRDFEDNLTPYDLGSGKVLGGVAVLRMSSDIPVLGFDLDGAEDEDDFIGTAGRNRRRSDADVIGDVYADYSGEDTSVKVPAGVTTVGDRAFYADEDLSDVSLPASITDIGEFAFARSGLSDISIPSGTKRIDYGAFYMCPNLTNVSIPESVDSIALGAFDGTPYLENWKNTPDTGDYLLAGDGVLLAYKGKDNRIAIPDNVKHIGAGAFSGNKNLESVAIPSSVQDIGEEAFCDCNNLRELVMDEGVRSIEDRAFKNSALKVVNIPDSVDNIGLSAFDNGGTLRTVIFNGNNVPNVTYNNSATRLSAKDLRSDAFEGTKNAIVSSNMDLESGTLFNPRFYGFSGEVYSVDPSGDNTLVLERALTKPDMAGNVLINQEVDIAGDHYTLDSVKSNAFDNYRDWSNWADNKPTNVAVNGERSEALDSLLADVNANVIRAAAESGDENDTTGPAETADTVEGDENVQTGESPQDRFKSNITVDVNGNRFPTRGSARATIPGDDDKYTLSISEDDSANNRINAAFLHSAGAVPNGYVPLSVDMYDKSGTVPIHKLGNSKMEVSIPVPSGMEDDEGIGIAYLDDNGMLTSLASDISDDNGQKMIDFVTGHCSTYVIYSRSSGNSGNDGVENVEETSAASSGAFAGTWHTINKKVYGPVSAKWFIIIILMAMSAILVLYDHGRKKKIKK